MRALLLGANGMLGQDIRRSVPQGVELLSRTRAELDVRHEGELSRVIGELRPAWVINASAYTNVDAAEKNGDEAMEVNGRAVGVLARVCRENQANLVHFSTDYVFDGAKEGFYSESDEARPLSVYGSSKLEGERAALRDLESTLVVRTQWLFGVSGRSFVGSMWERAQRGEPTQVVVDQVGSCTYAKDLAHATWQLMGRARGVVHYANRGRISRFEIAEYLFNLAGTRESLRPSLSSDYPGTAPRPANSALSVTVAERLLGQQIPLWHDAIQRFLKELREHEHSVVTARALNG